jgi:1,4-dihydroxy-2-naphthoate octaprenyltransferase
VLFAFLIFIGVLLGIGYTASPPRFAYRGLGEVDVALTHSVLVILLGYVSQGGALAADLPWSFGVPMFFAILPSIILAGFPDAEADQGAGKRTLVVRLGRRSAALLALFCTTAAIALMLCSLPWTAGSAAIGVCATLHAGTLVRAVLRYLQRGTPAGRIDGLLVLALSYMLWFAIEPLLRFILLLARK